LNSADGFFNAQLDARAEVGIELWQFPLRMLRNSDA